MTKAPKCGCWVKGKSGNYYYNPAMQKLYIQVSKNKKRTFKPIGWFCPHCKKVIIE